VNSLAPHPHHLPLFAASGLENDAKLFRPGEKIVSLCAVLDNTRQYVRGRYVTFPQQTFNPQRAAEKSQQNNAARESRESSMPLLFRRMLMEAGEDDEEGSGSESGREAAPRVRCPVM
jgi:hypothetical protein